MFILNPPYVSELLIDTIKRNNYKVLLNETSASLKNYNGIISETELIQSAKNNNNFKLYTNSENSLEWIIKNLKGTQIPEKIELFKNKAKFRNLLKPVFPDFYFLQLSYNQLKNIQPGTIKYPVVIKPTVGFLSFGVYPVKNESGFNNVIKNLDKDIEKFKNVFPKEVVDTSDFIIEEMIKGEEFAVDAYYNSQGEGVILNIFHHPFFDENDVTDRIYYSSKKIIQENHDKFRALIQKIGDCAHLKNFPMHIELRVFGDKILPIEINPMRFAGWCDVDVAYYAYGINIYEYYMSDLKPDWEKILASKGNEMYYFTGAEIPNQINKEDIKSFNYDAYLASIKKPLSVRKIDYKTKPLFAIVIGCAETKEEINDLLNMDLTKYIEI